MNKAITVLILFLMLTATVQAEKRKGVGCWRTVPTRHQATARMMNPQKSEERRDYFTGDKRGLVILAEFPDRKFKTANNHEKYEQILNAPGYTTSEGFRGSVADYFRDQSGGKFNLTFDVAGPYTAAHNAKYYGENDEDGNDLYAHVLVAEMCQAADEEIDFSNYDWDGDGEAEEVFVVYAGKGEADNYDENYIYPHMWSLALAGLDSLLFDGTLVDIYACSNEISSSGRINGIGTFCHEFSHCMGFPDFYDITYRGQFGMGYFDLMSGGNYTGNSFCPVGYTAYEKMTCGWTIPYELSNEDVIVDSLKPISEHGDTYIIYNDGNRNEYYLIENRQKTGWDSYYPAKGLLITHVDYDEEVWYNNIPNSILTQEEAEELGLTCGNDHQRMTLFHADNNDDAKYWNAQGGYYSKATTSTDLYPYQQCDSLTATSKPAATLFNPNSEGELLMTGAILDIKENSDNSMSFRYRAKPPVADAVSTIWRDSHHTATTIYDLQGRKVTVPKKGIYIVNGRKVVR